MVDVAELAGVSAITVSRVLSGHPSVRPETRARVERAVAELGYRRNTVASAFKSGRTSTIGVVLAGSELHELPQVLGGLETAARSAGYWLSLASFQGGAPHEFAETVQRVADQSDAVALIADRPVVQDALASLRVRVPMSVVMSGDVPNDRIASVEMDQDLGTRLAVRHLAELGHREVVHLSGRLSTWDARARVAGWRAELAELGLTGTLCEGDFTAASGYRLATELIAAPTPMPTAVFAGNDLMAMGVLAAFAERGIRVPQDVSLIGFDDQAGSDYLVPALTTVRQDFHALGTNAVEVLLALLRGEAPDHRRLAPALVLRRSTAEPRSASVGN